MALALRAASAAALAIAVVAAVMRAVLRRPRAPAALDEPLPDEDQVAAAA